MSRTAKILLGGMAGLFLLSLAVTAMACGGGGGGFYRGGYSCGYSQPTVIVREVPAQPQVIVQQAPPQPAPQQFTTPQFQPQSQQMPANVPTPNQNIPPQGPSNQADAQQSALEALAGWDGSDMATAASQTTAPTGNYQAKLPSGASIRMTLNSDGTFRWTAVKDGKTSVGQGKYTLNAGALRLVRSSDQQKLEGAFTPTQQGFILRVAGAKETNLNFVKV